jgi:hypothetical protein
MAQLNTFPIILQHIKDTNGFQNKEIACILDTSDSTITRILKGDFSPANMDMVLKTFNFGSFESFEKFNEFAYQFSVDPNLNKFSYTLPIGGLRYIDLTGQPEMLEKVFPYAETQFAQVLAKLAIETKSKIAFTEFDKTIEALSGSEIKVSPSRVRSELVKLLKTDGEFSRIVNIGFVLTPNDFVSKEFLSAEEVINKLQELNLLGKSNEVSREREIA